MRRHVACARVARERRFRSCRRKLRMESRLATSS
jgi:hypothetical protein